MELFYFNYHLTPSLLDVARSLGIPEGQPFVLDEQSIPFNEFCSEIDVNRTFLESILADLSINADQERLSHVPGVNDYFLYRTSTSRSPNTWKAEAEQISIFLRWVKAQGKDWRRITLNDLRSYYRTRRLQPSPHTGRLINSKTWNQGVGALSRLYTWAVEAGILNTLPFTYHLVKILHGGEFQKNTLTESLPDEPARYVTIEEYKIFRDALGRSRNGERDKTFADTLLSTGLRVSECNSLIAATLPDPEAPRYKGLKTIPFFIKGKGGKTRRILFPKSALRSIDIYKGEDRANATARLKMRLQGNRRHSEPSKLWLSERASPMSIPRWEEIFAEASERSGIRCTPHMLRHTFAIYTLSALIEKTICKVSELRAKGSASYSQIIHNPLRQLAKLLGHRHLSTTYVYLDFVEQCESLVDEAVEQWAQGIF